MFEGIITPIVTPFHRDEPQSLALEAMSQLVDHLIEKGVQGIFPLGSNGEFHVLSAAEKQQFTEAVITHVNKRVPVYVGTGGCSTRETIELSKRAESLGADAVSVITPYFITPNDKELVQHYTAIAKSVQIPIMLYNIPKNTGCSISNEVLQELTQVENIGGIKDSSGDMATLTSYLDVTRDTAMKVLLGSDSKILAGYQLGATGAIAGTSNLIVDTVVALDQTFRAGDMGRAQQLQEDIEPLRAVLKLGTVPSILKRAVELAGIAPVGPARKPVLETTAAVDTQIQEMLAYYQL